MNKENEYKLADGRKVRFPCEENWLVVNAGDASLAEGVCAVSVRNAPEGTPLFAFFLPAGVKVREMRRDPDLDRIDAAIVAAYPPYADILSRRVKPIWRQGGELANAEAWRSAPEPGYFDLAAWSEYWVGAMSDEEA